MFLVIPMQSLSQFKAVWEMTMAGTFGPGEEMKDGARNLVVFKPSDITLDEATQMMREIDTLETYLTLPPNFQKERDHVEQSFA